MNAKIVTMVLLVAALALTGIVSAGDLSEPTFPVIQPDTGRVDFIFTPEPIQMVGCEMQGQPILVYRVDQPYAAFPVELLPDRKAFYTVYTGDYVLRHGNAAPVFFSVGRYHTAFVDIGVCVP